MRKEADFEDFSLHQPGFLTFIQGAIHSPPFALPNCIAFLFTTLMLLCFFRSKGET